MNEDFWNVITCPHNLTTEPDDSGDAVCLRCGAVIQIKFNMDRFIEYLEKIRRGEI